MTLDMFALAIEPEAREVSHVSTGGAWAGTGRWVPANDAPVTIMAAVQPMNLETTGRELKGAPEGVRTEAKYMFWSRTAVAIDDHVSFDGQNYRVIHVWPWHSDGYNKAALGLLK